MRSSSKRGRMRGTRSRVGVGTETGRECHQRHGCRQGENGQNQVPQLASQHGMRASTTHGHGAAMPRRQHGSRKPGADRPSECGRLDEGWEQAWRTYVLSIFMAQRSSKPPGLKTEMGGRARASRPRMQEHRWAGHARTLAWNMGMGMRNQDGLLGWPANRSEGAAPIPCRPR